MKADVDRDLIVYFGGTYVPLREARVGILTHALHYGTGVFEGIRAYWCSERQELFLFRVAEHYERWKRNCGLLRITVDPSTEELCHITAELLRRNGIRSDAYVRPLAYKCAERIGVAPDDEDALAIIATPFGSYLQNERGIHAGVSAWRRIEDNAIPARGKICGAYVNSVLATDDARHSGFDEAILLDEEGHVAEGATCNVFMVRRGKLIAPPLHGNILEGITRDSVLQLAQDGLHWEIEERTIDRSELYVCDELFFTGTAVGIASIVRVDHRPVGKGTIGPVCGKLQELYQQVTHGRLKAYENWLTPVYHTQGITEQDLVAITDMDSE